MDKKVITTLATGLLIGITAPLIVEYVRKRIKKKESEQKPQIEANTDHGFVAWVGDDNFFELEGDTNVSTNPHMSLVPLTSKERMKKYPQFVKYKPFVVSPSKKIRFV